jgi:hypothetical protein
MPAPKTCCAVLLRLRTRKKSQTDKERRAISAYIEEVYLQAEREELIAQTFAVKLEKRCKRPSPTKADRIDRFQP